MGVLEEVVVSQSLPHPVLWYMALLVPQLGGRTTATRIGASVARQEHVGRGPNEQGWEKIPGIKDPLSTSPTRPDLQSMWALWVLPAQMALTLVNVPQ